jgi:Fe-S cluster assembly protein SufB
LKPVEKQTETSNLNADVVRRISSEKGEPLWMLKKRLYSLSVFENKPIPTWGPDLSGLKLEDLAYYVEPGIKPTNNMDELPEDIKRTFDALGIPEAERKFLSGNGAMYQSEVIYERMKDQLKKQGVIFMSTDEAVKRYPELVEKYFMTRCVPQPTTSLRPSTVPYGAVGLFFTCQKG